MQIETERLRLTPVTMDDIDTLHHIWTDPDVRRFLWDDVVIDRQTAADVVEANVRDWEARGYGLWLVHVEGEPAGFTGFRSGEQGPELLFGFLPRYWHQGYAFEAARAALRFLFEKHAFAWASTDAPNAASVRVLDLLGFRETSPPAPASNPAMTRLVRKHPLAIRWFHWINFPLLALMIWSGILIYWAYPIYRVGIGDFTVAKMNLEQTTWRKLGINNRLAEGMALHFFFMWLFVVNGVAYVAYTIVSGEWRELVPSRRSFREAWHVLLHDLHLRKDPPPPRKFNGAQQIAYTTVILMGLGSLLTGVAIYRPVQFAWLTAILGGYPMARFLHFWLTVGYVVFFVIHIAQVVRAGWNNFRAMVIGYEVSK